MSDLVVDLQGQPPLRLALAAMATRFELVLAGDDPVRLRAVGEEALREIEDCEATISPFRRGSAIARVNREAHGAPVRVDSLTFELLRRCAALSEATGGAFDITVGPLLRSLGFRGAADADAGTLTRAREAVGMQHVELDEQAETVRLLRPGMSLDVGAIGKGFALDLAADVLRQHGVGSALLHGGTSTVIAIGAPPHATNAVPGAPPADGNGWRVGVGPWPERPVAVLRDAALSMSAGHGRTIDGKGHVLDPRTGRPVAGDVVAAAVVATSATDADAWSTALLVHSDLKRRLPRPDAAAVLIAREIDGAVRWRRAGALPVDIRLPSSLHAAPPP